MYATLESYDISCVPAVWESMVERQLTIREPFCMPGTTTRRKNKQVSGMGIDGVVVMVDNPYDPEQPYNYQSTPLFAEYPYDPEYHVDKDDYGMFMDVFPSFPAYNSSTRIIYDDDDHS
jgi:hypothetical protein